MDSSGVVLLATMAKLKALVSVEVIHAGSGGTIYSESNAWWAVMVASSVSDRRPCRHLRRRPLAVGDSA